MSETGEGSPPPIPTSETKSPGFFSRIKESFRKDKRSEEEWQMDRIAKQEHIDRDQAELRYARYKQGETYMPSRMATEVGEKYGLSHEQVKKIVEQNLSRDDAEAYGSLLYATRTLEAQNKEAHQQRMKDFETGKAIGVAPDVAADIDAVRNFDMPETPKAKALREEEVRILQTKERQTQLLNDIEKTEFKKPEVVTGEKVDKNGNTWKMEIKIEDNVPNDERESVTLRTGETKTVMRTYTSSREVGGEVQKYVFVQLDDGTWYLAVPGQDLVKASSQAIKQWEEVEKDLRIKKQVHELYSDIDSSRAVDISLNPRVTMKDDDTAARVDMKSTGKPESTLNYLKKAPRRGVVDVVFGTKNLLGRNRPKAA
jgi:hypothetical protein